MDRDRQPPPRASSRSCVALRRPNLRHVADLVAGELHHIDVIRDRLFAGRLAQTTGTGMSTRKDTVGSDVVALGISGNTLVSWPLKQSTTACLLTHHPAHVGRAFG